MLIAFKDAVLFSCTSSLFFALNVCCFSSCWLSDLFWVNLTIIFVAKLLSYYNKIIHVSWEILKSICIYFSLHFPNQSWVFQHSGYGRLSIRVKSIHQKNLQHEVCCVMIWWWWWSMSCFVSSQVRNFCSGKSRVGVAPVKANCQFFFTSLIIDYGTQISTRKSSDFVLNGEPEYMYPIMTKSIMCYDSDDDVCCALFWLKPIVCTSLCFLMWFDNVKKNQLHTFRRVKHPSIHAFLSVLWKIVMW